MLGLVVANLLRRWGRTALAALGVAVGVTTIVALLGVTGGLSRSAGDLANLGRADFGVFQAGLADLTASSLPPSVTAQIRALPGVASASPIQIVPHAIAADPSILTFGSEPESFLTRRLVLVSGRRAQGDEAMVGVGAAARLHLAPGAAVVFGGVRVPVAAIYRSGISLEDGGVVLPLSLSQRVSGRPKEVSMVAVSIAPGYREATVERSIQSNITGTLPLGDPSEVARVDTNSRVIHEASIIIAVLAVLLGAVVVTNTMAMAVIERRGEFGVLAAVGWSRARIARLIVGESVAISLVGAGVGLALGVLASELLVSALAAAAFVSPNITAWVLGRGLLVGIALGVFASLFAVWQVIRVPPLKALQRS
jgi:putative ABC transport system permease protein